ncbi:MAG: cob(I)yrinic acid a,c-diamide adenosyltransferase [Bacteroidales bacterium]|nr:cob(I)yrinic acid a,c-diamide adenosyltransferase [Bacteroidales bacterium]
MKIYTKTGDKGETSLVGGKRVKKYDTLLEAYGTIDELNACTGMVIAEEPVPFLTDIQRMLFVVGGMLATETQNWSKYWPEVDLADLLRQIEAEIDRMSAELEPFRGFVLPQGSMLIAHIHVCRTVCRRAERLVVKIAEENDAYSPLLKLVNRLSDYFFILAQFSHKKLGVPVTYWK